MVARGTLLSKSNAQEVLNGILHLADEHYFTLEIVSYASGEEKPEESLQVRFAHGGEKTVLADSTEIAHCIAQDGRPVDLILGKPGQRSLQPAEVILGTI